MNGKIVGLVVLVIVVVVSVGFAFAQLSAPEASAKGKNQFQLDLVIQTSSPDSKGARGLDTAGTVKVVEAALTKGRYQIDSFFDITYAANIGSSGSDGNTANASFNVDSFFDIEYEMTRRTVPIEMVALSLRANLNDPPSPQTAIDLVRAAVEGAGADVYYGHVTVLK